MRKSNLCIIKLAVALALCCACTQVLPPPSSIPETPPRVLVVPLAAPITGHGWALLMPPSRAYAADRSWTMGGPLATQPMQGAEFHGAYQTATLETLDLNAPPSRWNNVLGDKLLQTQADCENVKEQLLGRFTDSRFVAQQASQIRGRLIDYVRAPQALEAARCVER